MQMSTARRQRRTFTSSAVTTERFGWGMPSFSRRKQDRLSVPGTDRDDSIRWLGRRSFLSWMGRMVTRWSIDRFAEGSNTRLYVNSRARSKLLKEMRRRVTSRSSIWGGRTIVVPSPLRRPAGCGPARSESCRARSAIVQILHPNAIRSAPTSRFRPTTSGDREIKALNSPEVKLYALNCGNQTGTPILTPLANHRISGAFARRKFAAIPVTTSSARQWIRVDQGPRK